MSGKKLDELIPSLNRKRLNTFSVKESVFPFNKFDGVDLILGPEMKSTGEVMGIDKSFLSAFIKSQIASGTNLPINGNVFLSIDRFISILNPVASLYLGLFHPLEINLSLLKSSYADRGLILK